MVLRRAVLSGLSSLLILLIGGRASGAQWPQWGGSINRDMVSSERSLPDAFEPDADKAKLGEAQNVKWFVRLGSFAYGNPTVADGKVFVGTNALELTADPRFRTTRGGLIRCFNESDGKLLWQLRVPERKKLPPNTFMSQQHLGICSSPTVDGDRVYVVTHGDQVLCLDINGQADGNAGPFKDEGRFMVDDGKPPVKLTPKDGDIIWSYDVIDQLGVIPHDIASCSILVVGDMLYLSSSNGVNKAHTAAVNPKAPAFIVLDKNTGRLLATEDEKISTRLWHAQWSSPSAGVVNGKTLIFLGGGDGICYAFEALTEAPPEPVHLKKVWSYDADPPEFRFEDGKPIPYYRGDKRKKDSPNKNDGKYLGPCQIIGTPVFHNNRVYVAIGQDPAHGRGRGLLHCIDATKTGDITKTGCIWKCEDIERSIATAAVSDGLLYINDIGGTLHCLDADTGKCYWTFRTGLETWGGPLLADGKLYFGNAKEFCILAAGKEKHVLGTFKMSAPVNSTPVAADGTLFIASNKYLWVVANTPTTTAKLP